MGVDPKPCVGALNITVEGIVKQLNSLNPYKASGLDGIPSWFLKCCDHSSDIETHFSRISGHRHGTRSMEGGSYLPHL